MASSITVLGPSCHNASDQSSKAPTPRILGNPSHTVEFGENACRRRIPVAARYQSSDPSRQTAVERITATGSDARRLHAEKLRWRESLSEYTLGTGARIRGEYRRGETFGDWQSRHLMPARLHSASTRLPAANVIDCEQVHRFSRGSRGVVREPREFSTPRGCHERMRLGTRFAACGVAQGAVSEPHNPCPVVRHEYAVRIHLCPKREPVIELRIGAA